MFLQYRMNKTWVATATLPDGRTIRATTYMGASNKLARQLRDMGVPDQPVRIFNPTGIETLTRPSLYEWGVFDYQAEYRKWLVSQPIIERTPPPV
jgi:hypothetical protein